mmetsp:Transcript_90739/g.228209  ORF Transcript_90739/g.228209 Transcript_90739/m.228209 type:complete len:619 (+) Transcript_90739:86-1942(+)
MESGPAPQRAKYANSFELLLTLVGYAVGLGNIWRFPYLVFTYGGGAFLIPYFICLALLGLPLFVLEMGLGQIYQKGTMEVWKAMELPQLKGIGAAATITTFFVSLYYNVILAWTIWYFAQTLMAIPSGILPWSDQVAGYTCPETVLFPATSVASNADLINAETGLFNQKYSASYWCPPVGIPTASHAVDVPEGFIMRTETPKHCPARAASEFWLQQALMQSSGMDDLGGFHYTLLASFVVAWILVYGCVFKGVESSGKVVYVTAILPYVCLVCFFIRAITLENAWSGIVFYLKPDLSQLLTAEVWIRAATQIFYSLGVGFGSLVAFASYGDKKDDFVGHAFKVSIINCGTSFFGGFVVFPTLGYLASELSNVNPCIQGDQLNDLASVGLSGTGLAFIAFPIAISRMPFSIFWAIVFFLMLFCLGIDSQFAMVESVMTVLIDSNLTGGLSKPVLAGIVCGVSALLGLVFMTKGGIYWFTFFDYYTCVASIFFVCLMECVGLMWVNKGTWPSFKDKVKEHVGRDLGMIWEVLYKFVDPVIIIGLLAMSLATFDLMGARKSKRFPEGSGYLPEWSIWLGWLMGLMPILVFPVFYALNRNRVPSEKQGDAALKSYGAVDRQP